MITEFTCHNFRNIECKELKFEKINVLIGPNNAGKSNFIRALSFVANMVNSNIRSESTGLFSELKRNGWGAIPNRICDNDPVFKLEWDFKLKSVRPVSYRLDIHTGKTREDNYIVKETLDNSVARTNASRPYNYFRCHDNELGVGTFSTAGMSPLQNTRLTADVSPNESVILQMDTLFFENKEMFSSTFVRDEIRNVLSAMREYFKGFFSYSCASFNLGAIRELQDELNDGYDLKKDGSNFVNVFATAMREDDSFYQRYLRLLQRIMHDCSEIKVESAAGKMWLELKIDGTYFPFSELSDGTIHLLLLLLMLSLPENCGLSMLAVDEPEMNLHPAWQKLLANEFLTSQSFDQCFISTHSPDFLDEFTEGFLKNEVAIFAFNPSSNTPIKRLKQEEIRDDLREWTLGDLYRIGDPLIGGWPQW